MTHVLVVEDEVDLREVIVELLESHGFVCAQAVNGQEALLWLREHPPPKLILLDALMPLMDAAEFREEQLGDPSLQDIPVVLVSGAGDCANRAVTLGMGILKKPFNIDDLVRVVGEFVQKKDT